MTLLPVYINFLNTAGRETVIPATVYHWKITPNWRNPWR